MKKEIYRIDNDGIYIDNYIINTENNTYYTGTEWAEVNFAFVEIQPPYAKTVKWESGEWIVIEEYPVESTLPQQPTLEERLQMAEDTILYLLMGGM